MRPASVFLDEGEEEIHYLGFTPKFELPYWAGYCDIPDGAEFLTAEELVNAPIYSAQSLKERWDDVRIISIEGILFDDWLEAFEHV